MKNCILLLVSTVRAGELAAAAFGLALLLFTQRNLSAAEARVLHGHVPDVVDHLTAVERLDSTEQLDLAIGLPLRNRDTLNTLLAELYDPASSQFHQFLTSEEFAGVFGPTEQDYQAVMAFAQANGLVVRQMHSNRMLLDVVASVTDIEKAFHITLRVYQHPTEKRTFYAPDREPSVDTAVPILDISGLDNFKLARPLVYKIPRPQRTIGGQPKYGSGPGGTLMGNDFRAAYAPNVGASGIGQVVGLLEFDGYYAGDITSYETLTGLPNVPLSNVLLDRFNGSPGSGNIEVALDIEMAIAMAPGLSQVIVYEAGPKGVANDILNRMATDNLAKQLSSSWSWSGGPNSTTDQIFQQFAAQGQSFFQASGDSDAYTGAIPAPSDDPYITVVGGTTLTTTGPGGAWVSETTWNWANSGSGTNGSGGGVSPSYAIPTWQQGISMSANQGSTTMRNIPDVALTADNIWVTYNNGSSGAVGGTSCAAPLWVGLTAMINEQALANGKPLAGFINPAIYAIGKGTAYGTSFHDITTGNNTNSTSPNKYFAVPGLDLCTGWGTPAGSGLINALAGSSSPQIVSNSLALAAETCTNNAVDPGETVTMDFGLINVGSASTANLVATLQASGGVTSPGAAQSYGVVTAGGAAVTRPFSFKASGTCGGTITATLQLQDGTVNLGTVSFAIRLGAVTTTTSVAQTFDGVLAPALPSGWSSSVISGSQVDWVTTNGFSDTTPNSAFALDAATAGLNALVSPVIPITSSSAQLTFRHNYKLVYHTSVHPRTTTYYDGAVLEISIAGGSFTDVLTAGGSFGSGGYNCTIATGTGNPLAGRQAWGGSSGGWIATIVNLPVGAAGQNIQLRWGCGTGNSTGTAGVGWFVDTISVQDSVLECCSSSSTDLAVSQTASSSAPIIGQNLSYTLAVANLGSVAASSVSVTDSLPSGVTFVSATPGYVNKGGNIAWAIGTLPIGSSSNLVVTVQPTVQGTITNTVNVSTTTTDLNLANNVSFKSSVVYAAPSITTQPTNQVTTVGGSANFSITATGSTPLSYQWTFNGTGLPGATGATLSLTNVQSGQAGTYAVVVTNTAGSATSSAASLQLLTPPFINSITVVNTKVSIPVSSVVGLSYLLEYKKALTDSSWTAASSWEPGNGGVLVLQDTNAIGSVRFYRIDVQ